MVKVMDQDREDGNLGFLEPGHLLSDLRPVTSSHLSLVVDAGDNFRQHTEG